MNYNEDIIDYVWCFKLDIAHEHNWELGLLFMQGSHLILVQSLVHGDVVLADGYLRSSR